MAWVAPKNGSAAGERQSSSSRRPALVREAEPTDVHGLGAVRADHASEAQVQAEAAQDAQASGQPVDLHVPVHRRLADAAGRLALGIEAVGQVGDRLLQALRDGREVLLVVGDQRRVGLGSETVRKIKRAGSQEIHVISSDPPRDPHADSNTRISRPRFRKFVPGQRLCGMTRVLPQAPRCAIY